MTIYLVLFAFGLLLSLALTPVAKVLAHNFNLLDQPGQRKIHQQPIPLAGGEVLVLSFAAPLLVFASYSKDVLGLLITGFIFVLFGLFDDAGIKIRARYKIWSHFLFALAFIYFSGTQFTFFRTDWINWLLAAGFITFMTNSMNMLDGMDGLVSGVSFFAAGFLALLAFNSGQQDIVVICLALMGATLGFLRYNFNPASIFLGEAGSTFLGFMLAVLAIKINVYGLWDVALALGLERLQLISFLIPLIVLGIPIFDTYFVFINRYLHNIKFSQPGKDHSHHRIYLMGFSQRATVLTLYAVQVVLGSIALAMIRSDLQQFISLLMIVAIFFVGFTIFLSRYEPYE